MAVWSGLGRVSLVQGGSGQLGRFSSIMRVILEIKMKRGFVPGEQGLFILISQGAALEMKKRL